MSAVFEMDSVKGKRFIGAGKPCYIIAEMSANHNNDLERAEQIVRAAADSGADAIKLQTYTADTMTIPCKSELFTIKGTIWDGATLHQLYEEASIPWEWQPRLMALANELGLDCFSTPFDDTSVDFLEDMGVTCYKVASFELVDIPLLKKIASTGKPVIMSTGMASLAEIDEAVAVLRSYGAGGLCLLKCTSAYPALPEDANLKTIPHMAQAFNCTAGLSDHTMGSAVPVAAVSLGAAVIEKHFTLSRADGGPDGSFSMEPEEFGNMVNDIRVVEAALGTVQYQLTEKQSASKVFRRSLFVVKDVKEGDVFTAENVRSIRPSYGMHTRYYDEVLGRRASRDIASGTPLSFELVK